MSSKIMIVCGSPRKQGNTNRVVAWVAEAAREAGAEVEIVDAPRLSYEADGCTACMGCQRSEEFRCVIDDEASPILARMPQADAIVLASPIYWHGPTAQLKRFTDRMFSLIKFEGETIRTPLEDLTLAVIGTAGGQIEHGLDLFEQAFKTAAGFLGFPFQSLLVPLAPQDPEDIEQNAELKEEATAFGRKLAGA
ncbi:flavodoxin family protein [Planctomycetota bacterium]